MTEYEISLNFEQYLNYCLAKLKLSQRKLSTMLGVSNTYVRLIAKIKTKPIDEMLDNLIKYSGMDRVLAYHKLGRIPPELVKFLLKDVQMLNYLAICKNINYLPYKDQDKQKNIDIKREKAIKNDNASIYNTEPVQEIVTAEVDTDYYELKIIENPEVRTPLKEAVFKEL